MKLLDFINTIEIASFDGIEILTRDLKPVFIMRPGKLTSPAYYKLFCIAHWLKIDRILCIDNKVKKINIRLELVQSSGELEMIL